MQVRDPVQRRGNAVPRLEFPAADVPTGTAACESSRGSNNHRRKSLKQQQQQPARSGLKQPAVVILSGHETSHGDLRQEAYQQFLPIGKTSFSPGNVENPYGFHPAIAQKSATLPARALQFQGLFHSDQLESDSWKPELLACRTLARALCLMR
jgi:hypothetical protein